MTVVVTAPYPKAARNILWKYFGDISYHSWKEQNHTFDEESLIHLLQEHQATGLITELDKVTEKVIQQVPSLKFIGVCRGTPSNVDVRAATKAGLPVFYTPGRNAQAVAEMFISNVIAFLRQTIGAVSWTKNKQWNGDPLTSYLAFKGNELHGKTVGLVGFGAVGKKIATLLSGFHCSIQYYDPYVEEEAYQKVSLTTLFQTSDIVSVHLPVTEETTQLIDEAHFQLMKNNAIFVNTARAAVVNRSALLQALSQHHIRGAILDVFTNEPPDEIDWQLITHPSVLATPHIAGATEEVESHHATIMNTALIDWYNNSNVDLAHIYNGSQLQAIKVGK